MKIKHLKLENFTCFENFETDFDDRLTVFVGSNGSGKTSILDALSVLSYVFDGKLTLGDFEQELKRKKYNKDTHLYLTAKVSIKKEEYLVTNKKNLECNDAFKRSDASIAFFDTYGKVPSVYYTAKRIIPNKIDATEKKSSFDAIFEITLMPQIDFATSCAWFLQKDNEEGRQVRDTGDLFYRIPELQAVRDAISKALGDYITPRMIGTPPELVVYKADDTDKKYPYTVNQLSDGYRTMLALIVDLARRMAVANAELFAEQEKNILKSHAVVLIDEVELHLHPSWQQKVLPSLLEIFPNVQFIVTTHSPQVLSSIEPKHIRILKDGKVLPVNTSTYGAESMRVLEEVFGVTARPAETEAKRVLDKYLTAINNGEYDSPEVLAYREKLDEWLCGDPILDTADTLIHRAKRQKAREASRA